MTSQIRLEDVHLHYLSSAFKDRSLKSFLARRLALSSVPEVRDVHALKGITLDIAAGERVGLLGANGAGKTTFLRMIAGLYPISGGRRIVTGNIRSLLELSLGFEPDATGRQNILYRGLLLGMNPKFMRSIEEEVAAFADLGEFIDYPLKTYSAGMQVRLAFAVSTAVGADLLLLDEVIGAGDASFMAKAKRRMAEMISSAKILLLASHDPGALRSLCTRGLVFRGGSIAFDGPIEAAVASYQAMGKASR